MVPVFSATLLLSAALLFLVQPMFARFMLPLFGSSPAVWTTSLLFFQTVLLAGYAYAHASTARLGVRRQAAVHLGLVAVAVVALPLTVPKGFAPPPEGSPVPYLLGVLTVGVGLPFFVLSATGPLLQRWLVGTDDPAGADPYFLYRASNLGSVIGLLVYPLVLEPAMRLTEQARAFTAGYGVLAALVAVCAIRLWRSPAPARAPAERAELAGAPTAARRLRWVALAFVASSFLLGVTAFLTTDVAPVPLLWALPLSLYLLSFVVVFSRGPRPERLHRVMVALLGPAMTGLAVLLLLEVRSPLALIVVANLAGFFVAAMVCHGELARDRPGTGHLTGFYLWIAVGGALGGAFNALVAPAAFNSLAEYPLVIVLACFARPPADRAAATRLTRVLDFALPVLVGVTVAALLLGVRAGDPEYGTLREGLVYGFAFGLLLYFASRPTRLGLGVAALLVAGALVGAAGQYTLLRDRDFFGVHEVSLSGDGQHRLVDGSTLHGAEFVGRPGPPEPLTYYHPTGPIGWALGALPPRGAASRTAVIGLGAGSMACYARPGARWTFFEINPLVERIARDPRLFTFLRDCPGTYDVVLGDARLSLARDRDRYGLIVADAFSSDSIPVHLITREALGVYLSRLEPHGALAFHVSNRYLELRPVLGALAADRGLTCLAAEESADRAARTPGKTASKWVFIARRTGDLGRMSADPRWAPCPRPAGGVAVWSDEYSNVVSLLRWL